MQDIAPPSDFTLSNVIAFGTKKSETPRRREIVVDPLNFEEGVSNDRRRQRIANVGITAVRVPDIGADKST